MDFIALWMAFAAIILSCVAIVWGRDDSLRRDIDRLTKRVDELEASRRLKRPE